MASSLTGIWAAPQPIAIAFALVGSTVTVTIAADCVAPCTNTNGTLTLQGGVPLGYRPSYYRSAMPLPFKNKDLAVDGIVSVAPDGFMSFSIIYSAWKLDAGAEVSGVMAQSFTYQI